MSGRLRRRPKNFRLIDVALHGARSQDFRQTPLPGALPQLHLEESVLGHHESLRKEQVVLGLGVDVGHSTAVAQHGYRTLQPRRFQRPADRCPRRLRALLQAGWRLGQRGQRTQQENCDRSVAPWLQHGCGL